MNTTCKKCPALRGDTYCSYHKKEMQKENEMCETGYDLRIAKGIDVCCKLKLDDPKIDKIMEQVNELDDIWAERFKVKEEE